MKYAAYGSNMNLVQMAYRCPNSKVAGIGFINDYELVFKFHADIVPRAGECVPVVLFDIAEEDWASLDRYEGFPNYYTTEIVDVLKDDGDTEKCIVYIMTEKKGVNYILPTSTYYRGIVNGYYENKLNDYLYILKNSLHKTMIREGLPVD